MKQSFMYFKPYQFGSKEFIGLTLTSKSQKQREYSLPYPYSVFQGYECRILV
ncbi:hypothetical protein Hanom_Chr08g00696281 [Helianthus anomalus]